MHIFHINKSPIKTEGSSGIIAEMDYNPKDKIKKNIILLEDQRTQIPKQGGFHGRRKS